ncbi:MAG: choice-of-anchor B family protein, partial [Gemmatimonadales bacterium]
AYVGAPGFGEAGAVFVFAPDSATGQWTDRGRLAAFDGSRGTAFGAALEFVGPELWVGAPGAAAFAGAVYRLRRDAAGEWWGAVKLADSSLQSRDRFGAPVVARGDIAVVGVTGADFGEGVALIFERDGRTGEWRRTSRLFSESEPLAAVTGGQVRCTDGAAAIFRCGDVDLLSFLPVQALGGRRGIRLNDLWGWTDPETGREYALVGRMDATAFVDVTEPTRPVYLGALPLTPGARPATWRDIKIYKDHAFIVSDGAGPHGMQVFDLRRLRAVRNPPVTFTEAAHYDRIHSAHNIVINEATGFAYSVGSSMGGETCGGGLHMIDIRDPGRPTFAGCFADPATGRRKTGYTHDAQCVTYRGPDAEHRGKEICFGANETALAIADVSDKAKPVALARAEYPNVGYAHQGWLTEDQRYFFMDDEGDELAGTVPGTRTLIWDVSDLDDPVLAKEYLSENHASDHNLYIRGNLVYQSNYLSGLRILDITDPTSPRPAGHFDTVPWGEDEPSFGGSWSNYPFFPSGIVVVTSGQEGVFVVKRQERPVP